MRPLLLVFCTACAGAACAWAQSGIEVPSIGAIVDPSGNLRAVQGLAGNFLLGPATATGVLSAACSEKLCLSKTDSKILSPSGETDAPTGPVIFGSIGEETMVYFCESRTFARWHEDTLEAIDWIADGEVLSIRKSEIAVRRDGNVWIVRPDGGITDWVAETAGPTLLLEEGVLFATPGELVLRHPDASEIRFELTGAESIAAMGARYAAIRAGNMTYALRTEPGHESLFLLPGNAP